MASLIRKVALAGVGFLGLRKLTALPSRRSDIPELSKPFPALGRYPNGVSSHATNDQHAIEPLHFEGPADEAQAHLRTILYRLDRCQILLDLPGQIWATTRSKTLGFIDDMDFLIDDEQKMVHIRAQARMGRKDFDKNRQRLELIRRMWREQKAGY